MHRYLAFIWDKDDSQSATQVRSAEMEIAAALPWQVAFRCDDILVVHLPSLPSTVHSFDSRHGVVLGSLYRRATDAPRPTSMLRLDALETQHIVNSHGRYLIDHYWGSYVAIVRQDGPSRGWSVLRDPTANLACFHAKWNRIHVFFSDFEDFQRYIPIPLSVNWRFISARLLTGFRLSRECGLEEIEDVPGGECITLSRGRETHAVMWHPAKFCVEDGLQDERRALDELRSTVLNVVHTLASEHSSVLVQLSGGLDSSIVTSCLAQQKNPPRVACLNFYVSSESGSSPIPDLPGLTKQHMAKIRRMISSADERQFAESVARKCGFEFITREACPRNIDFRRLQSALPSPRPSNYVFVLYQDEIESECAVSHRATACFTGLAGDTVFYATLRAISALDYVHSHPFGPQLLRHLSATASLSGESYLRVFGKAIKYGLLRRTLHSPFDPMKQPSLVCVDAAAAVSPNAFEHPWIALASSLCPGKHEHVTGVAHSVPFYPHVHYRERIAPCVNPLASQPVVETCLRIPTYVLLADGVSRGLARRAFGDLLPTQVARRIVKGGMVAFWQNLVRCNMRFVRECLLDGRLVQNRLLDRRKLEEYLVADQPFLSVQPHQIMDYLACETWLAQRSAA